MEAVRRDPEEPAALESCAVGEQQEAGRCLRDGGYKNRTVVRADSRGKYIASRVPAKLGFAQGERYSVPPMAIGIADAEEGLHSG